MVTLLQAYDCTGDAEPSSLLQGELTPSVARESKDHVRSQQPIAGGDQLLDTLRRGGGFNTELSAMEDWASRQRPIQKQHDMASTWPSAGRIVLHLSPPRRRSRRRKRLQPRHVSAAK